MNIKIVRSGSVDMISNVKTYVIKPSQDRGDWMHIEFTNGDSRRILMSEVIDWSVLGKANPEVVSWRDKPSGKIISAYIEDGLMHWTSRASWRKDGSVTMTSVSNEDQDWKHW